MHLRGFGMHCMSMGDQAYKSRLVMVSASGMILGLVPASDLIFFLRLLTGNILAAYQVCACECACECAYMGVALSQSMTHLGWNLPRAFLMMKTRDLSCCNTRDLSRCSTRDVLCCNAGDL